MTTENITSSASFLTGEMCVENDLKFIKCHIDLGLPTIVWQNGMYVLPGMVAQAFNLSKGRWTSVSLRSAGSTQRIHDSQGCTIEILSSIGSFTLVLILVIT